MYVFFIEMKHIDSYGAKSNILFVVIKTHQMVIVIFIKISSIDENPTMIMIHQFIKGIIKWNPNSLSNRNSFSNKIDFVFPTDETSSTGTTIIKRDKTIQENIEKPNGRVWTEFSDIKQVLAGKILRYYKTSNHFFVQRIHCEICGIENNKKNVHRNSMVELNILHHELFHSMLI